MERNTKKQIQDVWSKFRNWLEAIERYESASEDEWPKLLEQFKGFCKQYQPNYDISLVDDSLIINKARQVLGSNIIEETIVVSNHKIEPWFDDARSSIDWTFWNAYENYLKKNEFPRESIRAVSKDIDSILDKTGNPKEEGDAWERKGLVMGNVQSGKTLNFIGLMNKAVDIGYKVIILIGATNDNALRKQTQIRVDEGFTGFDTSTIGKGDRKPNELGEDRGSSHYVKSFTTRDEDFRTSFAKVQADDIDTFKDNIPLLFVIKKNKTILDNIYKWLLQDKELSKDGKKLSFPLLLIDDEADWGSINTKDDDQDPAKFLFQLRLTLIC